MEWRFRACVARLVLSFFQKTDLFFANKQIGKIEFFLAPNLSGTHFLAHMSIASFMRNGFHKGSPQNMEIK